MVRRVQRPLAICSYCGEEYSTPSSVENARRKGCRRCGRTWHVERYTGGKLPAEFYAKMNAAVKRASKEHLSHVQFFPQGLPGIPTTVCAKLGKRRVCNKIEIRKTPTVGQWSATKDVIYVDPLIAKNPRLSPRKRKSYTESIGVHELVEGTIVKTSRGYNPKLRRGAIIPIAAHGIAERKEDKWNNGKVAEDDYSNAIEAAWRTRRRRKR